MLHYSGMPNKKVCVIGAGPSGMSFMCWAAKFAREGRKAGLNSLQENSKEQKTIFFIISSSAYRLKITAIQGSKTHHLELLVTVYNSNVV